MQMEIQTADHYDELCKSSQGLSIIAHRKTITYLVLYFCHGIAFALALALVFTVTFAIAIVLGFSHIVGPLCF